jgi:hypothetical protein
MNLIGLVPGDPGAAFFGFEGGKDAHFARDQKAQRVDRLPHPAGIGHHRDPLPLRQMVDRDVEILPAGAGKTRADLVIKPDLAVPPERALHRRPQHGVAFLVGDTAACDDADHVVRQFVDEFDHRGPPFRLVDRQLSFRRP